MATLGVGDKFDQEDYDRFVRAFGTHYVQSMRAGGRFGVRSELTTQDYQFFLDQSVNVSLALMATAMGGFGGGIDFMNGQRTTEQTMVSSAITRNETFFIGGTYDTNAEKWIANVRGDPQPVGLTIRFLSELLTDVFFPNDPNIDTKAEHLQSAIDDWCRGLSRNLGLPLSAGRRFTRTAKRYEGCDEQTLCEGDDKDGNRPYCRVGDRRCLTNGDCDFANFADGTDRDCQALVGPQTRGAYQGPCDETTICDREDLFCRRGDRRCLTDGDCDFANNKDGTDRDCTRIIRRDVDIQTGCQLPEQRPLPVARPPRSDAIRRVCMRNRGGFAAGFTVNIVGTDRRSRRGAFPNPQEQCIDLSVLGAMNGDKVTGGWFVTAGRGGTWDREFVYDARQPQQVMWTITGTTLNNRLNFDGISRLQRNTLIEKMKRGGIYLAGAAAVFTMVLVVFAMLTKEHDVNLEDYESLLSQAA